MPTMFSHITSPFTFATKMIFQVGLLVLFVQFFGIPIVERYTRKEVLTVISKNHLEKIPVPSVTVVTNGFDWEKVCGDSEDIRACIEENTHSLTDTIHAELGFNMRESLMAPELWREDFTDPMYGRSYTLLYPHVRGNNWRRDYINLHVNASDGLIRKVFIHDPDLFVININPLTLPVKKLTLTPRSGRVYYSLALREYRNMDTPKNPCVEDRNYSFITCIKESLSKDMCCRLPWDTLSDQNRPECSTLQQHQAFGSEYETISLASMSEIFTRTGCQKPCKYREYVAVEGPIESLLVTYSYFSVDLWMTSTDITILTEILVYPWTSLIAEFGGTFGLFFGLSMMTLWDEMEKLAKIMKHW